MNNINYINWKSYYLDESINDFDLQNSEHIKLYNTNYINKNKYNINYMNPYLGEMVMLYYIWKNNLKSDYIIISQYRRDFAKINFNMLKHNKIQTLCLGQYEQSIIDRLLYYEINPELIIKIEKYISNKTNKSFNEIDDMFHCPNHKIFFILCFACNWDIFCKICEFIFYIFECILPNGEWKDINKYEKYRLSRVKHLTNIGKLDDNNWNHTWFVTDKRYFAYIIEIILGSCISFFVNDLFANYSNSYSRKLVCEINDNTKNYDLKTFFTKNKKYEPNYIFLYSNDKIKQNEFGDYIIKHKNNYVEIDPWYFMDYENISFINKQNYIYNNSDIKINIDECIIANSTEDLINNKYIISKINEFNYNTKLNIWNICLNDHKKQYDLHNYLCNDYSITLFNNDHKYKNDNINYLNKYYGELCTYYYVWKNNLKSDIIGFCHYRRTWKDIDINKIKNNGIQVYTLWNENISPKECLYQMINTNKVFDDFFNYIKTYCKDIVDINKINKIFNKHTTIKAHILISIFNWNIFDKLCTIIFGYLKFAFGDNWNNEEFLQNYIYNFNKKYLKYYNIHETRTLILILEIIWGELLNIFGELFITDLNNDHTNSYIVYTCNTYEDFENILNVYKYNIGNGIKNVLVKDPYNIFRNNYFNGKYDYNEYQRLFMYQDNNSTKRWMCKEIDNEVENEIKKYDTIFNLNSNEYIKTNNSIDFYTNQNYLIEKI